MSIFDLDQSITVEFQGGVDAIERKMLGLWADDRLKNANIGMQLVDGKVVVSSGKRVVTRLPFALFEQLAVKEIGDIIVREATQTF
jgi:hypothetical protein|tara:strand:- start:1229 stop:1486 length:258 start_codon:yes stop_codon:yes gene_type:complete